MKTNPLLLTDFYKISHRIMSEKGTEKIYSTFTPRGSRIEGVNKVVFFGMQGFIKEFLIEYFNENFFARPKDEVVAEYKRMVTFTLGADCATTDHIEALHDLGYLPLKIMAVPEGTLVPLRVPMMTIENTHPDFYWLTNFLETLISAESWKPITASTISKLYFDLSNEYADKTCDNRNHVQWQNHNFSYRGMSTNDDAIKSGAGHLLFSTGTDTIPSICYLEKYYNADIETELVGASVLATEHSIQCQYQDDYKYYLRMLTEVAPSGIVSIVSDGYDYWNVLTDVIPKLKNIILNRDGKLVVRPDSGIPEDIICGNANADDEIERKGSIELLWEVFGGTVNSKGYKELDPHIGLIYGDAITPERAREIFRRLQLKGFASSNVVFGVGSYSLGYHTRDTFGMAVKSTHTIINGKEIQIFKDPKTDDGLKKSQRGMVAVVKNNEGKLVYVDNLFSQDLETINDNGMNIMRPIFQDGKLLVDDSLAEIRKRIRE